MNLESVKKDWSWIDELDKKPTQNDPFYAALSFIPLIVLSGSLYLK